MIDADSPIAWSTQNLLSPDAQAKFEIATAWSCDLTPETKTIQSIFISPPPEKIPHLHRFVNQAGSLVGYHYSRLLIAELLTRQ